MQNTLVDLVKTLQAGMSTNPHPPQNMDPMYHPHQVAFMTNESPGPSDQPYQHHSSAGSGPTPEFYNVNNNNPSFLAHSPSNSAGSYNQPGTNNWATTSANAQYGNIDPALLSAGMGPEAPRRPPPPAPTHSESWPQAQTRNMHMSLPPSRGGSVTPDDILAPGEIINPLGAMTNMAGLVEAAVHRARNEGLDGSVQAMEESSSNMRRRPSPGMPHGPVVVEAQNLPAQSTRDKKKITKQRHIHAYPDAVEEGFVTEQEGRELMAM